MKYFELTKEEKKLLKEVEEGKFVTISNISKAKRAALLAAKNTLGKTRNINIRLSERDLQKLKVRAAKEGLPYQTLASSVLHRLAND